MAIQVRDIDHDDRDWLRSYMVKQWGSEFLTTRGVANNAVEAPGFVAVRGGEIAGILTYVEHEDDCEILCLKSLTPGKGVGSLLVETFLKDRLLGELITVSVFNDNVGGLGFFQHLGFRIVELLRDNADKARRKNPGFPLVGARGIHIRDELVLAQRL